MKDGTLILHLRASQLASDVAAPFEGTQDRGEPIKEHRYTVHTSPESKLSVNTFKLHKDLASGSSTTAIQYTSAIKKTNSFAPLYARQCSALDDSTYDIKGNGKFVSLGQIIDSFTLVFAVFIGPSKKRFRIVGSNYQFSQIAFREFSVLMLWSFLTAPAHGSSKLVHFGYPNDGHSPGYSDEECIAIFDECRTVLKNHYISVLERESRVAPQMPVIRLATYLKYPRMDTLEFRAWGQVLKANGII
jgi:hypothetical protein